MGRWALLALVALALFCSARWILSWHRARGYWRQAEASLARFDLESAGEHLDRYLVERPDDGAAWFLAARTARRLERTVRAERCLERRQQILGVTDATRLEWDLLRVQQGDLNGIDVRLRMSITPDHPDALLVLEALALGYTRAGRWNDALEACNLWMDRQPDHPGPWLRRGAVYERLSYLDQALNNYRRAVEIAPDDREGRLSLAGLLLRQKQPDEAAAQYEVLLERNPEDESAQVGLAACRIAQGRTDESIPLLDRVLEANQDSPRALFLRGKAAFAQDQPAKAERWLRRSIRLAPHDPDTLYQLSQVLRVLRKEEESADLLQKAQQLRKDYSRLDELQRLIVRKPKDSGPRHEAGIIALRLGRTDEGVRLLQGVLRLEGDHRKTHAALADHYRRQGDRKRAEDHWALAEVP